MKRTPLFRWQFALLVLIIVSLACSIGLPQAGDQAQPTATPTITPTPEPLPAALVETDPPAGSQLALNDRIVFYFNQPMDKASVVAAMSTTFEGVLDWLDDSTLVFTPGVAYSPASQINFAIAETAKAANGLAMIAPVSLDFSTADYLRLTQFLPDAGTNEVVPDSAVVASFNQPVVPLGADPATLPAAFTLEPSVNGKGEWINTSTYIFYPEPALAGGRSYTASLNPGLTGTSGAPLENTQSWGFTTVLPAIVQVEPVTEMPLPLDAVIKVTFNQPMDRVSTQSAFAFRKPDGSPAPGTITWDEKNSVLSFTPTGLLERNTFYTISIDASARSAGGEALSGGADYQVVTVPDFDVAGTEPAQNYSKPQWGSVVFYLTSLLTQDEDYASFVTVTPEVPGLSVYADERALNVYASWEAGKSYSITLSPALSDKYGQALGSAYTLNFWTEDASPNFLLPNVNGSTYMVRPEKPVLTAKTVNVPGVQVTIGSISLEDYFRLNGPESYDLRNSYTPPIAEIFSQEITLPRNQNGDVDIVLTAGGSQMPTGLYFYRLVADVPEGGKNYYQPPFIVSSNINILLKTGSREALAWVTDLRTNTPLANATVRLYNAFGKQLASGETNADGIWRVAIQLEQSYDTSYYAIAGEPGDDDFGIANSNWRSGLDSYAFGVYQTRDGEPPFLYMYTDRPIYRPGQTVYFKGVTKQRFDGRYYESQTESAEKNQVVFSMYGPSGKLSDFTLALSEYGTFEGSYDLPDTAVPGYYYFENEEYHDYLSFNVAEYRKPEINLAVSLEPQESRQGTPLEGKIDAKFFFGAPAGNLPVEWTLYTRDWYFSIPGYSTGTFDTDWLDMEPYYGGYWSGYLGRSISSGSGTLDADGTLTLPFEDLPEITSQQNVTLEVTVRDESNLFVSARASVIVHPADYYVGVKPQSWMGQAKEPFGFNLLAVDWQNKTAGNKKLDLEFLQVTWEREQVDAYYIRFTPVYTSVATASVTTKADGSAMQAFTPPTPGTYVLRASGAGVARTDVMVWVGGREQAAFPNLVNNRLRLTPDSDSYKAGDTARVFVPNPFGVEVPALVTLERGSISEARVINLPAGGDSLPFQITAEHEPNVYVFVTLLSGQNDFRYGYANLTVEPQSVILNVDVSVTPEKAAPGQEVTLDVRVTGPDGKPVQGELSLSVVDLAVLALADPNAPGIVEAFYDIQPLQIETGLTLANYARRSLNQPPGRGGGGGGGEAMVIREKFPDTAYWQGQIVTDADGRAQVKLTLPDNLTTWQVNARGLDKQTRVGEDTIELQTSKDLLIRPATPRFLVAGDQAQMAAIVNNNTGKEIEASVSLSAVGFKLDDPALATQKVTVPANGRVRVEWMGTAEDAASADLVFKVEGGGLSDASRPTDGALPILRYAAPQAFTTSGVVADAGSQLEIIALPRSFVPTSGGLDVELSPSLGAAILGSLDAIEMPETVWGAEEVISFFLPNLVTYVTLKDSGITDEKLQAKLQQQVDYGIQQLVRLQNPYDSGWGWQVNSPSDPYISAYALLSLQMAKNAGFNVLDYTIEGARTYFANLPQPLDNNTPGWEFNRAAFIAYATQISGGADTYALDALYNSRDRLDPWAQAYLALALESASPGDSRITELLSNLQTTAIRTSTGVHWESGSGDYHNPGTPVFATAAVVYALAQRDPATPLVTDAARYLVSHRAATRCWSSSYETAWAILALNQVMKGTGELSADFTYSATLNSAKILEGTAQGPATLTPVSANQPLTSLNPVSPNALRIERGAGTGKLYYRAALTVYRPVEQVAPLNAGMQVNREYFDAACKQDCKPLTSIEMSKVENIRVRITLTLPNDAYYVNVEDYIPAGSEIFNTNLKTTAQGEGSGTDVTVQYDSSDPYSTGWGWWLFGEPRIYDTHIAWSADYLDAGTYQLSYTLSPLQVGRYKVIPARAWMQYFPEVQGTSGGTIFEIK